LRLWPRKIKKRLRGAVPGFLPGGHSTGCGIASDGSIQLRTGWIRLALFMPPISSAGTTMQTPAFCRWPVSAPECRSTGTPGSPCIPRRRRENPPQAARRDKSARQGLQAAWARKGLAAMSARTRASTSARSSAKPCAGITAQKSKAARMIELCRLVIWCLLIELWRKHTRQLCRQNGLACFRIASYIKI
jgi:hypothetical protein